MVVDLFKLTIVRLYQNVNDKKQQVDDFILMKKKGR